MTRILPRTGITSLAQASHLLLAACHDCLSIFDPLRLSTPLLSNKPTASLLYTLHFPSPIRSLSVPNPQDGRCFIHNTSYITIVDLPQGQFVGRTTLGTSTEALCTDAWWGIHVTLTHEGPNVNAEGTAEESGTARLSCWSLMERSQSIAEQGQGRVRWRECGEEGGEEEAETWREEGQGLQAGPFNVTLPGTITEAKQGDPCLISSSPILHHYLCPQPPTRSRTFPFSLSTTHTASVQPSNVPSLPLPPPGRATLQPLTSHRPSVASRTSTIRIHHNTYTIQDLCPLDAPQTGTRIMLTQPFHRTITHPRPAIPPHPPTQAHLLQVPLQLDDGLGLCSRALRTQSTQSDSYTHIHLPALKSKQTCARLGQTISLSPLLGAERTAGALGNCSSVARRVFQRKVTGERVCAALNPVSGHLVVGDEGGRLEVWGPEGLSGEAGEEVGQVSCRGEKEGGSEGKEESSQAQVTLQSRGREGGGGSVEARLPSTSAKAS